jgi:hypothetical protein
MWEDVTIALACLGFAAALALIVAELRGLIAAADPFEHDPFKHAPVERACTRSMGAAADPARRGAIRRRPATAVDTAGATDQRGSQP